MAKSWMVLAMFGYDDMYDIPLEKEAIEPNVQLDLMKKMFNLEADPETQQAFYQAHMNGDEETKAEIHEYYYEQTSAALQEHITTFLQELEETSQIGATKDVNEHPRLPLILSHNAFVKETFERVQANLLEYAWLGTSTDGIESIPVVVPV